MTLSKYLGGKVIIPALLLAVTVSACDSSNSIDSEESSDTYDINQSVSFIASDLGLDAESAEILAASFDEHEGRSHEPGFLWQVAAEIQGRLSDEQKELLLERISNRPGPGAEGHNGGLVSRPFMGRPGFFARQGNDFVDILQLSDDQIAAIKLIRDTFGTQLRGVAEGVKDGSLDRTDAREQMQVIKEELRTEMDSVLTDDQKAALETVKEERMAAHEQNVAAAKEVMIAVLGLDEGQIEDLEALRSSLDDERLDFRELIEGGATREDIRELAADAHAANLAALSGILDQTQYEIFVIHGAVASRMKRHKGPRNNGMLPG